jgi:hypothetical protein
LHDFIRRWQVDHIAHREQSIPIAVRIRLLD